MRPEVTYVKTRIRILREEKELSQKVIAAYLQCDQSLHAKYELEKREIPLCIMMKLADYYETSVDYLTYRTDMPKPYPRGKQGAGKPISK